jgi:hypothetical protein
MVYTNETRLGYVGYVVSSCTSRVGIEEGIKEEGWQRAGSDYQP